MSDLVSGQPAHLVPVTFSVVCLDPTLEITQDACDKLAERYMQPHHGGVDVRAKPGPAAGEVVISGLFPESFAEARGY